MSLGEITPGAYCAEPLTTAEYPDPIDQGFHDAIEEAVNAAIPTLQFVTYGTQVK